MVIPAIGFSRSVGQTQFASVPAAGPHDGSAGAGDVVRATNGCTVFAFEVGHASQYVVAVILRRIVREAQVISPSATGSSGGASLLRAGCSCIEIDAVRRQVAEFLRRVIQPADT